MVSITITLHIRIFVIQKIPVKIKLIHTLLLCPLTNFLENRKWVHYTKSCPNVNQILHLFAVVAVEFPNGVGGLFINMIKEEFETC